MHYSYRPNASHGLERLEPTATPQEREATLWDDLYSPTPAQVAEITALGIDVPTLADMEEIEISNRLYREAGVDYMTVVLPGLSDSNTPISGPVCFILSAARLITVRHHTPRPFETYPLRADRTGPGCARPEQVFLGLMEEIIGRLADLLEGIGRGLDAVTASVYYRHGTPPEARVLQEALDRSGREGDLLGRVRLALLTQERALSFFGQTLSQRPDEPALRAYVKGLMRDIQALEVHAGFLGSRVGLTTDATLGMINLAQNGTVRIVSVVAALFLPPTLIASVYGMNFATMPELDWRWGYPSAVGMMLLSAVGTYLFFKWKRWL